MLKILTQYVILKLITTLYLQKTLQSWKS